MKEIKALSKQIQAKSIERDRIQSGANSQAANIANANAEHDAAAEQLRKRKAQEHACAVLEARDPDVSAYETEQAIVDEAGANLRTAKAVADEAAAILQEHISNLDAEIADLTAQRTAAILAILVERRTVAINEYVAAAEALGGILARAVSADRAIRQVEPISRPASLPGEALIERVRHERLPIPWGHSGRERPTGGAPRYVTPETREVFQMLGKYEPQLPGPRWMSERGNSDLAYAEIVADLQAVGVTLNQ
ncbi:hypothetical protein [Pararobbsia silviterrae]|uniref:Uncharacterized protein n=1 Tax=Pararobbsia silviterrae TaxID=1792498 RepID=A0A494YEY3_9BURK|nr:hypothetical protein [Pararobbsia silviterrae]RKP58627.1 hypothetical protein D7S86_01400 [Pararobbsia silviterrae]